MENQHLFSPGDGISSILRKELNKPQPFQILAMAHNYSQMLCCPYICRCPLEIHSSNSIQSIIESVESLLTSDVEIISCHLQ